MQEARPDLHVVMCPKMTVLESINHAAYEGLLGAARAGSQGAMRMAVCQTKKVAAGSKKVTGIACHLIENLILPHEAAPLNEKGLFHPIEGKTRAAHLIDYLAMTSRDYKYSVLGKQEALEEQLQALAIREDEEHDKIRESYTTETMQTAAMLRRGGTLDFARLALKNQPERDRLKAAHRVSIQESRRAFAKAGGEVASSLGKAALASLANIPSLTLHATRKVAGYGLAVCTGTLSYASAGALLLVFGLPIVVATGFVVGISGLKEGLEKGWMEGQKQVPAVAQEPALTPEERHRALAAILKGQNPNKSPR